MFAAAALTSATPRAKIFIVEDEGLVAHDLESRVRREGYEVVGIADSGEQVLEELAAVSPDLILMDIRLNGGIDGIETADLVQSRYDVPIVYLTAHTDRETLDRAKITGPFGYLAKPINQGNLSTSIEVALYKHKIERELRQQRAWLRTTLRTMCEGIVVTDDCGRIQYLNPAAEELTHWTSDAASNEPIGNVLTLWDPPTGQYFDDLLPATMLEGKPTSFPPGLKLVRRDGESVSVEGEIALSAEDGVGLGAVITFRDNTLREREDRECHQDRMMQALGRLATEVANTFNNFLAVTAGLPDLLLKSGQPLDEPVKDAIDEIKTAAASAANLTRKLRGFSHSQPAAPEPVDLTTLVQQTEARCRRSQRPDIEWKTILEPSSWPILACPEQISQVLINLVENAQEAMPAGGTLTVRTENITMASSGDENRESQRFVLLMVTDTGIGVDPAVAEHIFEPFFTTKPSGTGLGLSVVRSIVDKLGGGITFDSRPGKGSAFRVILPAA
jgi:two-component system, cell cycle sensor histidine kinase and response regulator CckA